jgi:hypothetical protein
MAVHDLNGAFQRVARADKHLGDLRREINNLYRAQENSVRCDFDPDPPHKLRQVTFENLPLPPMTIGILIGEVLYNLRSALDYLVFALARHDSGCPQEFTQFPIVDKRKDFRSDTTAKRLRGINPAHVAAIERLQPYNGVKWIKTLRDFSNTDKHREFVVVGGDVNAVAYTREITPNFEVLPYPVRGAPHPAMGQVDVKIDFTGRVQFDDGTPILETLAELVVKVKDTLVAFQPEFK